MYKNPFQVQSEIRKQLSDKMIKDGTGVLETAIAIGIAHTTLGRFINKGNNVTIQILGKIMRHLEKEKSYDRKDKGSIP